MLKKSAKGNLKPVDIYNRRKQRMKRNYMTTARGFQRGLKAQSARLAGMYCSSQEEAEAGIPEGSEKYLKAHGNRRYYVFWRPGSQEAEVSKEWKA